MPCCRLVWGSMHVSRPKKGSLKFNSRALRGFKAPPYRVNLSLNAVSRPQKGPFHALSEDTSRLLMSPTIGPIRGPLPLRSSQTVCSVSRSRLLTTQIYRRESGPQTYPDRSVNHFPIAFAPTINLQVHPRRRRDSEPPAHLILNYSDTSLAQ